ncbi:MAG: hypothetical protein ACPGOV_08560 [Magnetovibrionaceae bacterium]
MKRPSPAKCAATWVVCLSLALSGCVTSKPATMPQVGPATSNELLTKAEPQAEPARTKLDVVIPVFDPGLPEELADASGYDEETELWPELRRAEANRFAVKLKEAIEATGEFGSVWVTPNAEATGDLYLLGTIDESDGEDVSFDLQVVDVSGRTWLDDDFDHDVDEDFHENWRNKDKDPYQPAFDAAAEAVVALLKKTSEDELAALREINRLRFAKSFADDAFSSFLSAEEGRYQLVGLPSEDDPMLERVEAIRVRDQLFLDQLQPHYASFSSGMDQSYGVWQEQALMEHVARRQAQKDAAVEAVGGVLLIGLAVLAAVAGASSDTAGGQIVGATGAAVGGMMGADLLQSSFQTSKEAELHREALEELGQSINMELAPRVVEFQNETVELTGDAVEQFNQWRAFLAKMHEIEMTPDRQL